MIKLSHGQRGNCNLKGPGGDYDESMASQIVVNLGKEVYLQNKKGIHGAESACLKERKILDRASI